MKEKDLFKKAIEEEMLQKENIRRQVINKVHNKYNKGAISMKRKIAIPTIALAIITSISITGYAAVDIYTYNQAESFLEEIGISVEELARGDAKKVYKDIESDTFQSPITKDVLITKANEMGIEQIPQDTKEIYESIVEYHGLIGTAKITSSQIKKIEAGMTYKKIIKTLGNTKDVGSGVHVLQYAVDGDKILYISFADENDICNMSGEEMSETLVDAKQDNEDENTFNATLVQRSENNILVSCPTFDKFDVIDVIINDDTQIVFEDGRKGTIDDIYGDIIITITGDIKESYPPQSLAMKIIIKTLDKNKK